MKIKNKSLFLIGTKKGEDYKLSLSISFSLFSRMLHECVGIKIVRAKIVFIVFTVVELWLSLKLAANLFIGLISISYFTNSSKYA